MSESSEKLYALAQKADRNLILVMWLGVCIAVSVLAVQVLFIYPEVRNIYTNQKKIDDNHQRIKELEEEVQRLKGAAP